MSTKDRCDCGSCSALIEASSPLGVKRTAETLTEREFVDDYLEKVSEEEKLTEDVKLAVSTYKDILPEILKSTYYNNILDSLNIEVNEALHKVKDAEEVLLKAKTHLHTLLSKSKIALKAVDDHWKEREVVVASVEDTPLPPSPMEPTSVPEVLKDCVWAKWDWLMSFKNAAPLPPAPKESNGPPLPPSPKESNGPSLFPFMLKGIMYKRIGYLDDGDVIWQEDNDLWHTTEDETLEYGPYAGKLTHSLTLDNSREVMEKEPDIGSNLRLYETPLSSQGVEGGRGGLPRNPTATDFMAEEESPGQAESQGALHRIPTTSSIEGAASITPQM